jgi:hypothetical protein
MEARVEYSPEELLADGDYAEPLVAGGVRCHGGFEADGRYRSPRSVHRAPAIRAWQERLRGEGAELIELPRVLLPPQYPNAEQSKLLLREGVRDPVVRALTVISIVEGFGAIIRDVKVPDLSGVLVEPLAGTALAHLGRGLFEAHARDEAGHRDQGGHKQMWEAARDLALESPRIPPDVLMRIMGGTSARRRERQRAWPELDAGFERMLLTMISVLVIEVFAEGTFEWGKALLSDPEVSAEPVRAGAMISYIQSDESPHVEYLRTALSEIRARTLRTVDGRTRSGREVIDRTLDRTLREIWRRRTQEERAATRESLREAAGDHVDPGELLERFDALETRWAAPERTGFEPTVPGAAAGG